MCKLKLLRARLLPSKRVRKEYGGKKGISVSLPVDPKSASGTRKKNEESANDERATQKTVEKSYEAFQVNAFAGSPPGWRFSLKTDSPYLEGSIVNADLCECHIGKIPGSITARFCVDERFIKLILPDKYNRLPLMVQKVFKKWV